MVAATQSYKTPAPTRSQPAGAVKYVSWEQFQRRYLAREDGYTYEWTNGKVEKTKGTMEISQLHISPNDRATKVSRKVQEYFQAGVKVVWNIYPALGEVHVFESATAAQICMGDARCSAEAALPGFVLPVSEILAGEAPAM